MSKKMSSVDSLKFFLERQPWEGLGNLCRAVPQDSCLHLIPLQLPGQPAFENVCLPWPPAYPWPGANQCYVGPARVEAAVIEPYSSGSQFWLCQNYLEGFLNKDCWALILDYLIPEA